MTDEKDRAAPFIGQFSGPQENAPRVALRRKEGAPGETAEAVESTPAKKEEGKKNKPRAPEDVQKEFLEGLKDVGLEPEKARTIMDEVLSKGYYTETHSLRGKPLVVRSRSYRDTLRAQRFLEVENPTYAASMDEIVMRYNSAASIVQLGDRTFDHPEDDEDATNQQIEDEFEKRRRFLETLPSILVGKINTIVFNMDVKLAAVFAEGAPEDF